MKLFIDINKDEEIYNLLLDKNQALLILDYDKIFIILDESKFVTLLNNLYSSLHINICLYDKLFFFEMRKNNEIFLIFNFVRKILIIN